ncbi:alkaline shock response membrane anchor protein AmaP [Saccharomonospora saliphila]|uniref:alkaline shock response membrane anchor protein AmaP n=1 Tax=Saccharomonospora saliphila TaxID=369829 RepID=UPI0003632280|nr:alkaline shock response membrane anchor protein AmaP [Saccharomonospora saliphila]
MHADRTNRTVLLVLALLLLAAGGFAGAASIGLFGEATRRRMLTDNVVAEFIGRNGAWFWPVAAAVAVLVVLLCLRWLLAILFSTDRTGDLPVSGSGPGRTTLSSSAVPNAVSEEIESYHGVDSARARLVGPEERPTLVVTATLEEGADLAALRERIETEAMARARATLDRPDLPIRLDLVVSPRRTARAT